MTELAAWLRSAVLAAAVLAVAAPDPSWAKGGRKQPEERGGELRAVREVADSVDSIFMPVSGPVVVKAGEARYLPAEDAIVATGGVTVAFGPWLLRCDSVRMDLVDETASGEGSCTLEGDDLELSFERAELKLESLEGLLLDMAIDGLAGKYRFEAGRLRRMASGQIYVDDGWMTPCGCGGREPAWSVKARFLRIDPEGGVHHKRGWFCLGRKRVLPLPSGRFDGVTGRASGLMLPEVRLGGTQPLHVGLPIYIAASRNTDLTLTPAYVHTRGFLLGTEFRYAIAPNQGGTLSLSVLRDAALLEQVRKRIKDVIEEPGDAGYSDWRFWGQWRHYQRAPHGLFGAHVDVVRDDMVMGDFEQDYSIRRTPYLASNIWGGAHSGRGAFRAEVEVVDDLANVRNGRALHSLPHLYGSVTRLSARPHRDLRLSLDVDADLVAYAAFPDVWAGDLQYDSAFLDVGVDGLARGDDGWPGRDPDSSEADSHYSQGEPVHRTLRTGGGVRLSGQWSPGGWLWITPWAEARGALFGKFRVHDDPGLLGTLRTGAVMGTALFRDFGGGMAEGGVRHIVEPRLSVETQPLVRETLHPVLTHDDLQQPHARVQLEVINRLQRGNPDTYMATQPRRQALEVRAALPLEMLPEARFDPDVPVEPLRLELAYAHPFGRIGARTMVAWKEQPFQTAGVGGSLHHPNGNRLSLAYDWVEGGAAALWSAGRWYPLLHGAFGDEPIHEMTLAVTWVPYTFMRGFLEDPRRIVRGFSVGAHWRLNLRDTAGSPLLNHEYSVTYTSPCACWRGGVDLRFASDWSTPSFGIRLDLLTQ